MVKISLKIDGMACSMCEAHICDTIRRAFPVKKVSASHGKGTAEIIAETAPDEQALKSAIAATGYTVTDIHTEPYEKKGFSLFRK